VVSARLGRPLVGVGPQQAAPNAPPRVSPAASARHQRRQLLKPRPTTLLELKLLPQRSWRSMRTQTMPMARLRVVGCSARPWEVGWLRWVMVLLCGVVVWLWGVAAWLWGVVVSWWAAVPRRVEAPHLLPRMAAHTLLALSMAATTSMRTTQATLAARRAPRWRESRALCDALVASLSGRKSAAGPRSGTVGSA